MTISAGRLPIALRDAMNSLEPDSEQLQILFLPLTTAPDGLAALLDPNRAPDEQDR